MSGWADSYIAQLREGDAVRFRPKGGSMAGVIESGDLISVAPPGDTALKVGDIVLCSVRGRQFVHFLKEIKGEHHLIGNSRGHNNGWIGRSQIHGRVVAINGVPRQ